MYGPQWVTPRRVVAFVIVVLLVPTFFAGVAHVVSGGTDTTATNASSAPPVDNLTLITAQGRSPDVVSDPGGIEIINTTSKDQVWAHDDPDCMRYYDAEPIDNSTLFLTANCEIDSGERLRLGIEHDWRTNTTERVFQIPYDGHDVDRLGPHRYAVADISRQQAYVVNYTAGEPLGWATFDGHPIVNGWNGAHDWAWNFTDHYPEWQGEEEGYGGDYTHLNDIDSIYNDTAFLLSPRDFNRVIAVDRRTDEVLWTLGSQDDVMILYGQHHPVLLEEDPTTVLVGDSLNHRVIEYQYVANGTPADARDTDGGRWEQTWAYYEGLNWPRSVDRLPNGNTLITDTGNDRVIEVSPNGTVVWEYDAMANPYEAERYVYGDEPQGPTMAALQGNDTAVDSEESNGSVSPIEHYHRLAGWVLPVWVGTWAFVGLVLAAVVTVGWVVTEIGLEVRRRLR